MVGLVSVVRYNRKCAQLFSKTRTVLGNSSGVHVWVQVGPTLPFAIAPVHLSSKSRVVLAGVKLCSNIKRTCP